MLSSWEQCWISDSTDTDAHPQSCTFITLELSTHVLPWVISFRPYPLWSRLTGNVSARLVYPRNLLIWCWLPEISPVNRPEVRCSLQKSPLGLLGEWKRKLKGRREDAGQRKEKKEMWREGMRWGWCTVRVELRSLDRRLDCCSGQSVFPEAGLRPETAR